MTQAQALTILKTGANVFLTGEPGSGKTHTLNQYVRYLKNVDINVAITASTGIAATHIGGQTIHSWSGIGIKTRLTKAELNLLAGNSRLRSRMERTSVLIIDEISMLDADTLNTVDQACRRLRERPDEAFGGLQIVLVGDFFQLPPVAGFGTKAFLACESEAWQAANPVVCYLTEQHRQSDRLFLQILSAIRASSVGREEHNILRSRLAGEKDSLRSDLTKLFPRNENVDRLNLNELNRLTTKPKTFQMKGSGRPNLIETLKRGCLSPAELSLKTGAAVMFTKNSPDGDFVNGSLGIVEGFESVAGHPIITLKNGHKVLAEPMEWSMEDDGKIAARVTQIPLRLAWAMTVHKSQGMSLDAVYMDLRQAFAYGQGYVALSRVRSLGGLYLAGYNDRALQVDPEVAYRDQRYRRMSELAIEALEKRNPEEMAAIHVDFATRSGNPETVTVKQVKAKTKTSTKAKSGDKVLRRWSTGDDLALSALFLAGKNMNDICAALGRQPKAVRARLAKQGLIKGLKS